VNPAPSITVVGAGIIGSLTAHELLARWPEAEVTVIDRDTIGSGASLRSAGLHFPRGGTDRVRAMSEYSADFYAKLKENHPTLPIYPLPQTSVITDRTRLAQAQQAYLPQAMLTALDTLPNTEVRVPADASLWRIDGCHQADVHGVSEAVALELRGRARFREGVRVTGLEPAPDRVGIRLGTDELVHSDLLVLAPGPWLHAPAWAELLSPMRLRIKKIVALHIDRVPGEDDRAIVFQDEDAFLIPVVNRGHWLFSYTCQEWDVEPDALHDGLSAENLAQARECLSRYAPALAADCTSGRVFCDAYSPAGEPLVTALEPSGRIIFAGAANGSGYRLAPAIAAEVADLVAGHVCSTGRSRPVSRKGSA